MAKFKVILIKHGYPSVEEERKGGDGRRRRFIDGDQLSDAEEQKVCEEADGILVRWRQITPN